VLDRKPFTRRELVAIKTRMHEIVAAEDPITRDQVPVDQARALFEARGDDDKVRLLNFRNKPYLTIYTLRGVIDYFYGYMVPTTRYLPVFDVLPESGGSSCSTHGAKAPRFCSARLVAAVVRCVSPARGLDPPVGSRAYRQLEPGDRGWPAAGDCAVMEALHERQIAEIAARISRRHRDGLRLVLVAGPSSSGKTTFSKRLAIQLIAHGLKPYTLEMDRYFVARDQTPRDEKGEYDFEALEAVDLPLFNEQMLAITASQP